MPPIVVARNNGPAIMCVLGAIATLLASSTLDMPVQTFTSLVRRRNTIYTILQVLVTSKMR